ncbi:TonB-dependent receptor family protein [Lysobacter brunescens]|uniref:TonB-dependent receptor family protein n=1 Tax=Lysobacter brunescens TaxID=262323 RepID=A0ABW2YE55_9GAMM
MTSFHPLAMSLACACCLPFAQAHAQDTDDATELDRIEVVGSPRPKPPPPGAIARIDAPTLREGQRQVNLSEALQRVPGFTALDRNNYAQDLQIQTRGFGARSTFGIRGVRLIVDGIPSSGADGQGQAASFPLSSLDRIEVLRGPLALRHGSAPGGVILGSSEAPIEGAVDLDLWAGDDGARRANLQVDGRSRELRFRWRAQAGTFATDGLRPQSATRRHHANALGEWQWGERDRLRVVFNGLHQPLSEDPLGLTAAAFADDPEGTDPAARRFDTRKTVDDLQFGATWMRTLAAHGATRGTTGLSAYRSDRRVEQSLALPATAQAAAGSAGGVIDLARVSDGLEWHYALRGPRGRLELAIEAARLDEARRGYENFVGTQVGVRGRLRRDERNRVDSLDAAVVGSLDLAHGVDLLGGVRASRQRIDSRDRFLANGDDSGARSDDRLAWSLGIEWAYSVPGTLYAHVGEQGEAPTLNELAYRADGSAGLNRDLDASRARSVEAGWRWRGERGEFSVAAYRIDTLDEIVPALNRGGRASFANAGATRREGVELGAWLPFGERWTATLAASWVDARFEDDFAFVVQNETRTVSAGNRMPGIPRTDLFAELAWHAPDARWSTALEARAVGRIAVDDRNTDAAPGHARFAWRLSGRFGDGWRAFLRVDNLFDRRHAGSVIVNEANGRFFEPGAGRSVTVGIGWRR